MILVLEDDASVRAHTCELLGELGYVVHAVSEAPAALALIASEERIDLLFTDVVLAGPHSGAEVAEEASALRPALPVLFTSGYARDVMIETNRLDNAAALLSKPFTMRNLAVKLRNLLD